MLSKVSLKRTLKHERSKGIVDELAEYFAKLIFRLVDVPKDQEIYLPLIKEVKIFIINFFRKLSLVIMQKKQVSLKCSVVQIISRMK